MKKPSSSRHDARGDDSKDAETYNNLVTSVGDAIAVAKKRGEVSAFSFGIPEINESTTITSYDVLLAWYELLRSIGDKDHVYSEYFGLLGQVHEATVLAEEPSSSPEHLYTLLKLLTQAVQSHKLDASVTCRFVTLLEILHSYAPSWHRVSDVVEQFWMRLTQRIPSKVTAIWFRRKAYRVLVSLSWVPSTKGLLEACSFDDQKDVGVGSFSNLDVVRPRWDILNQLLDRLKDETDVCVGITSRQPGVGKSTLAAQVASHPSIRRAFKVIWLDLSEPLTYDRYHTHLKDMLAQAGISAHLEETVTRRLEEPALLRIREERSMKLLKTQVSSCLEDTVLLLVLDQMEQAPEKIIPWFQFHTRQSIIVTTTSNGGDDNCLDWSLQLDDVWNVDEAVDLFLHEADLPSHFAFSSELRNLCKNARPLTIRVIARWLRLKKVSIGLFPAVNEIRLALKALGSKDHPLFDILSLMMGPKMIGKNGMTVLFLLCFSSFCTVFRSDGAPLEAVLMLWEEIMAIEPLAVNEISGSQDGKAFARWVAEGLFHMGVISIRYKPAKEKSKVAWVEAHHRFYKEFAIIMAREMDLRETFAETVIDWNSAFVAGYFARKAHLSDCLEYCVENLQSHMLLANMVDTVADVLSQRDFFNLRVKILGWEMARNLQIQDCISLADCLDFGESMGVTVFQATSDFFRGRSSALESSKALYTLALNLAQNGYYDEAIKQFKVAADLPQNKKQKASILYGIAWCLWSSNLNAREKIDECRRVMEQDTTEHELRNDMLILFADILVGECCYQSASSHFETILEKFRADPEFNPIELGVTLYKYGRLFYLTGNTERAKVTLEECIKWKRDNGETSRSLCDALGILGDVQQEMDLSTKAKESYESALQTLENMECDESHLDYRLLAAKVQVLRNDISSSLESFELVRKTSIASPLLLHDQSAYDLRCIARAYEEYDKVAESAAVLRESLSLTRNRPNSLERAAGKVALGNCLILLDSEQRALECYNEAENIQRDRLGDSSSIVIDTVNMIGHAQLALGQYDDAIKLFESNYEKTKQANPNDVERLAGVLYLIADAYEGLGKYSDAAWNFNQCLGYLKKDRSSDHPDIAKTMQRLADATAAQGDVDMAYGYYAHAVNIRRKHNDPELLTEALFGLGVLAKVRQELETAEAVLSECLEISQKNGNDPNDCRMELGHVHSLRLEFLTAKKLYSSVSHNSAENNPKLFLAHLLLAEGELSEAHKAYQAMESCPESLLGLAVIDSVMGNKPEAMSYIDNIKELECPQQWLAVCALLEGDSLHAEGKVAEAKSLWGQTTDWGALLKLTERRMIGGLGLFSKLEKIIRDDESGVLRRFILLESARGT